MSVQRPMTDDELGRLTDGIDPEESDLIIDSVLVTEHAESEVLVAYEVRFAGATDTTFADCFTATVRTGGHGLPVVDVEVRLPNRQAVMLAYDQRVPPGLDRAQLARRAFRLLWCHARQWIEPFSGLLPLGMAEDAAAARRTAGEVQEALRHLRSVVADAGLDEAVGAVEALSAALTTHRAALTPLLDNAGRVRPITARVGEVVD